MVKVGIDYYPEHWSPSLWEKDIRQMAHMGIHTVRLGEFAWCRLEPEEGIFDFGWLDKVIGMIKAEGMQVILGTPTNCPPLWMYQKYPDIIQWEQDGTRSNLGIRGHRCMQNAVFRGFAERIIDKLAERYAGKPEIAGWQLDNEIEINHCTCPACSEKFRSWVKEKYKTMEAVNAAWGTDVWSGEYSDWQQITPLRMKANYQRQWYNPAWLLDYERFSAYATADYINFQAAIIRKYDADAIITTNACFTNGMPDFHQAFRNLNVAGYDNYPPVVIPREPEALYSNAFGLDFIRGTKQKDFWIMEQLGGHMGCWAPISPTMEPGMLEGYAMQAVAHGAELLSFFRWRTSLSGAEMFCHGLLDHSGVPNRRLAELGGLIERLKKLPELKDTKVRSRVAILYGADQEFAMRNQKQSEVFDYWTQLRLFHNACMGLGVNVDVIEETADLSGYQVVIAPTHFVTDPVVVEHLEQFAREGGSVVITNRSGVQDKHGNCIVGEQLPTGFSRLCGCRVAEYDPIGEARQRMRLHRGGTYEITGWCDLLELDTAEVCATYMDRFYAGTPAITRNSYGKGWAYYVGTIGRKSLYRTLLLRICEEQEIPVLEVLPQGVEANSRESSRGTLWFLFNNTLETFSFPLWGQKMVLLPLEMKIWDGKDWI